MPWYNFPTFVRACLRRGRATSTGQVSHKPKWDTPLLEIWRTRVRHFDSNSDSVAAHESLLVVYENSIVVRSFTLVIWTQSSPNCESPNGTNRLRYITFNRLLVTLLDLIRVDFFSLSSLTRSSLIGWPEDTTLDRVAPACSLASFIFPLSFKNCCLETFPSAHFCWQNWMTSLTINGVAEIPRERAIERDRDRERHDNPCF